GALKPNVLLGLGSSSHDDNVLVRSELRDFTAVTGISPVQISAQPTNTTGLAGSTANLSVQLNDPVDALYQWFVNGTLIPNATNATYTTAPLSANEDNSRYSVRVARGTSSVTSTEARLSVVTVDPTEFPDLVFDFDDGEVPPGTAVFGTGTVDPSAGLGGSGG